ncbi:hypothetical protein ACP70R_020343 [Stipagrostis hirtigluma subsp. patula]
MMALAANCAPSLLTNVVRQLGLFLQPALTNSSTVILPHQRFVVDELNSRCTCGSGIDEALLKRRYHADVAADHVVKELASKLGRPVINVVEHRKDERSELQHKLLLTPHRHNHIRAMATGRHKHGSASSIHVGCTQFVADLGVLPS